MEIYLKRTFNGFTPLYGSDHQLMNKIKVGDEVKADIKKPRNYKFHKMFFALLNIAFQNQDCTQHFDAFRRWMIVQAGRYELIRLPDGTTEKEPLSISFAKMDQEEFDRLYKDMVQVVIMVTGADEEMIENELINFM